jgi:integrase
MVLLLEDILSYVKKYSKVSEIKKLNHTAQAKSVKGKDKTVYLGINWFYTDVGLYTHNNVSTLIPFIKASTEAFNPSRISLPKFKAFIKGLSKMVYGTTVDDVAKRLKLKHEIKKNLLTYHTDRDLSDPFYVAWSAVNLNVTPDEFKKKKYLTETALEKKNSNVFQIEIEKAQAFYESVFKPIGILDRIIAVQAALGTRLVEVLNSNVSNFEIEGDKIRQTGFAKCNKDQILIKEVIGLTDAATVMEWITKIREKTEHATHLQEYYTAKINNRLAVMLQDVDIFNNELKSSHGLRRLYVAWLYFHSTSKETLSYFIKRLLGHSDTNSVEHYNTIELINNISE